MDFVAWVVTCNVQEQWAVWSPPVQATQQPQLWVPFHVCEGDELLVCWEIGRFWICLSEHDWEGNVWVTRRSRNATLHPSLWHKRLHPHHAVAHEANPAQSHQQRLIKAKVCTSAVTQLLGSKVGSLCGRCANLLEMRFSTRGMSLQTALREEVPSTQSEDNLWPRTTVAYGLISN